MRKIRFRGVDSISNKWVYGDCLHISDKAIAIVYDYNGSKSFIHGASLGQATDFLDKFGTEIYEGDIIKIIAPNSKKTLTYPVFFSNGRFGLGASMLPLDTYGDKLNIIDGEVIGNLYFNSLIEEM